MNNLSDTDFLTIVSKERVEGTLPRILQLFNTNVVLIYRAEGGYEIMSAVSFYTKEEVKTCADVTLSEQTLNDVLGYCKNL
jgi:hypothetical protein